MTLFRAHNLLRDIKITVIKLVCFYVNSEDHFSPEAALWSISRQTPPTYLLNTWWFPTYICVCQARSKKYLCVIYGHLALEDEVAAAVLYAWCHVYIQMELHHILAHTYGTTCCMFLCWVWDWTLGFHVYVALCIILCKWASKGLFVLPIIFILETTFLAGQ